MCSFKTWFYSLPSDVIPDGTGLQFFDELVKNPVQLVLGPHVFIHRVVSSAANPYRFFQPSCGSVCLLVYLFCLFPPKYMLLSHSMFCCSWFEDVRFQLLCLSLHVVDLTEFVGFLLNSYSFNYKFIQCNLDHFEWSQRLWFWFDLFYRSNKILSMSSPKQQVSSTVSLWLKVDPFYIGALPVPPHPKLSLHVSWLL